MSAMEIQGVLSAVQCGDISTGRAREMIDAWLAGKDINPMFPAPDVPNPFGMDDNPAEVVSKLLDVNAAMVAALREARLQIEHLHGKFQATGSGNCVLAQIDAAIALAEKLP